MDTTMYISMGKGDRVLLHYGFDRTWTSRTNNPDVADSDTATSTNRQKYKRHGRKPTESEERK